MVPREFLKVSLSTIFLLIGLYTHFTQSNFTSASDFSEDEFKDYLKKVTRIPVFLQYPQLFIFSSSAINDFRKVSSLLADDSKCEFMTVESNAFFNGDITSLEPVLCYIKDGETHKYEGPLNASYILAWLTNQDLCEMRIKDLNNFKSFQKELTPGHIQAFVLFGEGQHDPKLVENVRKFVVDEDLAIPVLNCPDPALTSQILKSLTSLNFNGELPTVLVSRNLELFPKLKFYSRSMKNEKDLRKFLKQELIPSIHSSNSYMLPRFLVIKKTIVYIFTKDKDLTKYLSQDWIASVPKKHDEKLVFLHSKGSDLVESKMNAILAIDSDYEECAVRAFVINLDNLDFYKFKPLSLEDGTLNEKGMERFIDDLENDRLSHYVKSELPIPPDIDKGPVKTIVGEDFHRRVLESEEDVLVLFLSSWCGHCHKAKRLFRDMGRRLKGSNGPILATFDAYNNEVEDIEVQQFPTIVLFRSGKKNDPIFYTGQDNLEDISSFLEQNCKKNKVTAENIMQKHVSKERIFEFHSEL